MDLEAAERARLAELQKLDALLRSNLPAYCAGLVKIRGKDGSLDFLTLNRAQLYVDELLRQQKERTGRVRAIILKARQLGISTYIAARFYQKTTMNWGQRTYILTHEDKATQNLFQMAKRIHEHMEQDYQLTATSDNANELDFGEIDSGYRIGTAKNIQGGGRSQTFQNFHGSEVAFWDRAETHFTGAMQAVPDLPHTEVILESTANGIGGVFYDQWLLAERGESQFLPIFLPWYWDEGYRRNGPHDFQWSPQETDYAETYGLDEDQVAWMHYKNIELGGTPGELCWAFRQEYPASATEAFQTSGGDTLIKPEDVIRARRFEAPNQDHCARVMGVDIARGGGDKSRLIDRQGRKAGKLVNLEVDSDDLMVIAGIVGRQIDEHDIQMTFIDGTGLGSGVFDRLRERGYGKRIRLVHFGGKPMDEEKYKNKRAEMWDLTREWLTDDGGAEIPDDDTLHRHLCAPTYKHDSNDRLLLEKKEEIKKRLGFSPDGGDALGLTFAEHVRKLDGPTRDSYGTWADEPKPLDWMTM